MKKLHRENKYIVLVVLVLALLFAACSYLEDTQIKDKMPAAENISETPAGNSAVHSSNEQITSTPTPADYQADSSQVSEQSSDNKNQRLWPTEKWSKSSPEKQGMDSSKLLLVKDYIKPNENYLHSLLIARHGYIVFEEYYNGYSETSLNSLQSITKSIVSALTGIALNEGFLESVDQRVEEIYPQYFNAGTDEKKRSITIEHLLTMSAGFKWQQSGDIRSGWAKSDDRNKYLIELPLQADPGEEFNYSAGISHLMSGILTKTTGMSTLEFADDYLFKYLGISSRRWDSDNQGYSFGNNGLYLTTRDLAKFGYLYLNNGFWDGKQIIPPEWVGQSTEKRIGIGSEYADYGYYWWVKTIGGHECFFALGYGGQYLFVIPDLDIIAVITSSSDRDEMEPDYFINIINSYVIDSVIS